MRLVDLEAGFLRHETIIETWVRRRDDGSHYNFTGPRSHYREVATLAEADGVEFLCPYCYAKNGGAVGTHCVICWFRGKVAPDLSPGPGRWEVTGVGLEDLTLSPSVNLDHDPHDEVHAHCCRWHGWIKNGEVT